MDDTDKFNGAFHFLALIWGVQLMSHPHDNKGHDIAHDGMDPEQVTPLRDVCQGDLQSVPKNNQSQVTRCNFSAFCADCLLWRFAET